MRWLLPLLVLTLTGCASATPTPASSSGDEVTVHSSASCAFSYNPAELARQVDFALDGTVTEAPSGSGTVATVRVDGWLRGGDGSDSVTLPLGPAADSDFFAEDSARYSLGDRLLISGAYADDGSPLVWGCGFTRPWDRATYDDWVAALG